MQIYTHAACLAHDTGPDHPERPARLRAVLHALEAAHPDLDWQQAPPASRGQLLRVHDAHLLDAVLETAPRELQPLDPDTLLSPQSAEAALRAAGADAATGLRSRRSGRFAHFEVTLDPGPQGDLASLGAQARRIEASFAAAFGYGADVAVVLRPGAERAP